MLASDVMVVGRAFAKRRHSLAPPAMMGRRSKGTPGRVFPAEHKYVASSTTHLLYTPRISLLTGFVRKRQLLLCLSIFYQPLDSFPLTVEILGDYSVFVYLLLFLSFLVYPDYRIIVSHSIRRIFLSSFAEKHAVSLCNSISD
uniref:Transmembrane protein n=1 Tax=Heterorhabditis bacteriophora TaxID=37862 RepID=A0A1I7WZP3_HETBA